MKINKLTSLPPRYFSNCKNSIAKETTCVVQIIWPAELKDVLYFTKGYPLITMDLCQNGMNVKIEFFVPDAEEKLNSLIKKDIPNF